MTDKTAHPPIIFGEVLFDLFPDGNRVLGGAPFNVAWHLQAFGLQPLFVSRVGEDEEGRAIRTAMEKWGFSLQYLQQDKQHPTGRVQVQMNAGEPSYDIVMPSAYDYIASDALPEGGQGMLYHGSLALRSPTSRESLQKLKRSHQGPVFIDINLRSPWWDAEGVLPLLKDAHWVKLNEDELFKLSPPMDDLTEACEEFIQRYTLQGLILTRGSSGALVKMAGAAPLNINPKATVKVVDTVGAGDAFASILMLGLISSWPLAETLERAQDFASQIVSQQGATVNDPGFYEKWKASWGLSR